MSNPSASQPRILLFNKPFQVMSQFSPAADKATLAQYITLPAVYPAGRLDFDSEGLLILTDNGVLQHLLTDPKHKLPKTYWVQVEGTVTNDAIGQLGAGVKLKDGMTLPARCKGMEPPSLWDRNPPIRYRANIPTSWLELTIIEGRNRQVRRMTAAVGFPTLRLIRVAIGPWSVDELPPGEHRWASLPDAIVQRLNSARTQALPARTRKTSNRSSGRRPAK